MTTAATGGSTVREVLGRHMLADGLPLVVDLERSRGVWLQDAESGERFLDFFGWYATSALGFNHPGLREPAFLDELGRAAINKLTNSDLYSEPMARFVTTLSSVLPDGLRSHLFFIEGGALAVENALKAAFDWKRRLNLRARRSARGSKIIHFRNAFHGRTGYTLSLTNTEPKKIRYFPKFDWPRVSAPALSFPVDDRSLETVRAAERQCLAEIQLALAENPHEVAALIIEPIQGEGGDNHFRGEFLRRLRRLADEAELLLIFDEVQTGFGTTGKWWCFQHFDMEPDIVAFGKKSQVCGIAASSRLDCVDSVFHVSGRINSTWGGNLADMVRCRRIIEIVREEQLLENAEAVGRHLLEGLRELSNEFPKLVTNPRGRGMLQAFDLPDAETRDRIRRGLFERGLLVLPCGQRSIRFRPPLILAPEEADEGLRRCAAALRDAS